MHTKRVCPLSPLNYETLCRKSDTYLHCCQKSLYFVRPVSCNTSAIIGEADLAAASRCSPTCALFLVVRNVFWHFFNFSAAPRRCHLEMTFSENLHTQVMRSFCISTLSQENSSYKDVICICYRLENYFCHLS